MRIAIVSDIHFSGKKLADKKQAWECAVDTMLAADVSVVVLAGDTFHGRNIGSREASTGSVFEAFMTPAKRLIDAGVKVIAIKGNGIHEGVSGEQKSPLEILKGTDIEAIDDFGVMKDYEEALIAFIPWDDLGRKDDLARWISCIKKAFKLKPNKMKIIVGHLTVPGVCLNSGIALRGSEFEISREELEGTGADLILLGHLHSRQQVGAKVSYVGALTQNDFGEENNPTGFSVVDTIAHTHEFIEVDSPRYYTIEEGAKKEGGMKKEIREQDYVKYRFTKKPENYDELIANPNVSIEIIPEREAITRKVEGIESGRSDEELLDGYLKEKGRGDEDRKRIVELARGLNDREGSRRGK